jgi:hypothetical protein
MAIDELEQQLHYELRFVDQRSIRLQDGRWTFNAKPGVSHVQLFLLMKKVEALGGSYHLVTQSFSLGPESHAVSTVSHVDTRHETVKTVETVETPGETVETGLVETQRISLFWKIESQLAAGETLETVAKRLGIGRATVARAKRVLQEAPEEIKLECRKGQRTINSVSGSQRESVISILVIAMATYARAFPSTKCNTLQASESAPASSS